MKQVLAYVVLGVAAYGGFLIATFPAERAVALIQKESPLRVTGVTGTAWSGRAATLQLQDQALQRVKWQFKPWSLLLARLEFTLNFEGDGRSGQGDVGLQGDGSLRFSNLTLQFPIAEFDQSLGLGPLQLTGMVNAQLDELTLLDGKIQSAEGRVDWQGAGVSAPMSQAFGGFEAKLTTVDDGIKATVKDSGGPLQLDGILNLSKEGAYQFKGSIAVRDVQQRQLVQGVAMLGVKGADGRVQINYSGKL